MGNQIRITEAGPLHNDDGSLAVRGWATSLVREYSRERLRAPKHRIKEWDYYLVNDDEYAVALTVSDLAYVGLISASVIDFAHGTFKTTSAIVPLPMGKFALPASSAAGVTQFENKRVSMRFEVGGGERRLSARFAKFDGDEDLEFEAVLDDVAQDTMVISTPWAEDPLAFYYNQKNVALPARGSFRKGGLAHEFAKESSFGLLDWGRGVWTRDNTWFWGVAQGEQEHAGRACRVGLNIGYGFGDTSAASENIFFVDGVAHKLGRLDFGIPEREGAATARTLAERYELMAPWHMSDDEGRFRVTFTPAIDRVDWMDYKLILTDQHQVFGTFDGTITLDDGTPFELRGLRGSAEVVRNKY